MFRFFFLMSIWFLSCGQDKNRKQSAISEVVLEKVDSLPDSQPDSFTDTKSVFHWRKWEKPDPKFVYLSDNILKHVAKGHVYIDGSYGDLDNDGVLDLVIMTGLTNEDSLRLNGKKLPRHLLVFLSQKDFAFLNTKAIPCINCCGLTDPYAGHIAGDGEFIINENCITNSEYRSEYRFRYVPELKDWLLDSIVTESHAFQKETYKLDTMTKKNFGKVSLKTFDINKIKTMNR